MASVGATAWPATASLPITATPSGTPYILTASYAGGTSRRASSTTSNFTVGLDPTSTTLAASELTATQGDVVTFTATVAPTGPSFGALTGTVSFAVDGNAIGTPVTLERWECDQRPPQHVRPDHRHPLRR